MSIPVMFMNAKEEEKLVKEGEIPSTAIFSFEPPEQKLYRRARKKKKQKVVDIIGFSSHYYVPKLHEVESSDCTMFSY